MITEPAAKNLLYNFDQLKDIAGDNNDFLKTLAEIFVNNTPQDSAELVKAAKTADWQMVYKYAHKMKSTVDSMNMISIKTDLRTLEMDAKNKTNADMWMPLALKVNDVINEVSKDVKRKFRL